MRSTRCFSNALTTATPGEAIVLLLIAFAFLGRVTQAGPRYSSRIVETKTGAIRGIILELNSRHLEPVEAFRGVPYAAPPVGDLRYRPPAPPLVWSGTRLADTFGAVCPQRYPDISNRSSALLTMPRGRYHHLKRLIPLLANQNEDCLFLNLYVPGSGKYRLVFDYCSCVTRIVLHVCNVMFLESDSQCIAVRLSVTCCSFLLWLKLNIHGKLRGECLDLKRWKQQDREMQYTMPLFYALIVFLKKVDVNQKLYSRN